MDKIKLSVRELVEFVYKSGDISARNLSLDRAMEGIRAHKILQSQMGDGYRKEFYLKSEFIFKDIMFFIEGRADGILTQDDEVTIDEIKSTYTDLGLIDEEYRTANMAQAKCYAYMYGLMYDLSKLSVQVRYYNLDTKETKTIKQAFGLEELKTFFYGLLETYLDWAETIISLGKERDRTIEEAAFPFKDYRKGQREFSVAVYRTIEAGKKLFAQAPTGVGKTVSVLFPAIKSLHGKNSKIFYLTAKSTTKTIAFNTVKIMHEKGLRLRTAVITAKDKICFMEERKCEPEYCPYAKGYYDKLNIPLRETLKNDCLYDREFIEDLAKKHELCPFELSLDLAYMSDIVICDYNYYFDPRVGLQREDTFNKDKDIVLIDEAHNLEDRARDMYSPEIIKEVFYEVYKRMKTEKSLRKELYNINRKFIDIRKSIDKAQILQGPPEELINALRKFTVKAEKYFNENKGEKVPEELTDIYFQSVFFIKISEIADDNFCYYADKTNNITRVKLFLIDPSQILKEIQKKARSSIFFSATLTPLKYFRYMLGGDEDDHILRISSPFRRENLNLMISSDISMKYTLRDSNIEKACEYINTLITERKGNYLVFFPSYHFMNKVYSTYETLYDTSSITLQCRGIEEDDQKEITDRFENERNVVVFTVVGGVFSEGIDLPLDKLIGAVIIGTGIPQISFERNIIKAFFDDKMKAGYDFAYKYPGFNKVLQSAGRVIRTEEDKGTVLLIDSRFCQHTYLKLFPDHWKHYKRIYSPEEIKNNLH
ncbi:MAG: ATP-dependent DNA helicase [Sedimentibacter sp.]|jgi:Rad3-related DNA helicase